MCCNVIAIPPIGINYTVQTKRRRRHPTGERLALTATHKRYCCVNALHCYVTVYFIFPIVVILQRRRTVDAVNRNFECDCSTDRRKFYECKMSWESKPMKQLFKVCRADDFTKYLLSSYNIYTE